MTDRPVPAYVEDPIMAGAFASFVQSMWDHADAHEAFTAATGMRRPLAPRNPLDRLIDEATGNGEGYMEAFIAWLVREHWGEA